MTNGAGVASLKRVDDPFWDGLMPGSDPPLSITLLRKIVSQNSEVSFYRLHAFAAEQYVAVKEIAHPTEKSREALRLEFEALRHVRKIARGELDGSVPEPLRLSERQIMLGLVPGVPFDRTLKKNANLLSGWLHLDDLGHLGRQVGEWLARFHHLMGSSEQEYNVAEYMGEIENRLPQYEACGIQAPTLRTVRERILQLSAALDHRPVPRAACHGDFIPQNILLDGTKLGVVDFAGFREQAAIYHDLGHFLGYLTLLGLRPSYLSRALKTVATGFVAGYSTTLDLDLLRLFLVRAVLRMVTDRYFGTQAGKEPRGENLDSLLLDLTDARQQLPLGIGDTRPSPLSRAENL